MLVNGIKREGGIASDLLGAPEWVDDVAGYVPVAGSAEDIYTAYKRPSLKNIGWAIASTGLDLAGLRLAGKALKAGYKGAKALYNSRKVRKAYNSLSRENKALMNTGRYMAVINKQNKENVRLAKKYGKKFVKQQTKDGILNTMQNLDKTD